MDKPAVARDSPSLARAASRWVSLQNRTSIAWGKGVHTPHSSAACVDRIRAAVGARHLTVAIETQVPQVPYEQVRPWGKLGELVDLNMRMQLAGIGGGVAPGPYPHSLSPSPSPSPSISPSPSPSSQP